MVKDNIQFQDGVSAGLDTTVVSAKVPCPECEAETKEHEVDPQTKVVTSRICSKPACRHIFEV